MMPELGKHVFPVLASYGVTLGVIAALVIFSVIRARRVRASLAKLESEWSARRG